VTDSTSGKPVLPIYFDDNYVTLLPGEERSYTAKYFLRDSDGKRPIVTVNGWNVKMVTLK